MNDILLALGIGVGCGAVLFGQCYVLREWNRTLPLNRRWINYVLGNGTLLVAFALWGALTGHLSEVAIFGDILVLSGAATTLAYAMMGRQEADSVGTGPALLPVPEDASDAAY